MQLMKTLPFLFIFILIFSACEDTSTGSENNQDQESKTALSPERSQELTYNDLVQKFLGSTEMGEDERFRFLMVDKRKSLLHFFSVQKKDQDYALGADYQTCTQIGNTRQSNFDLDCQDLYDDEYSRLDQSLRSILESPRHDEKNEGQQEFYFQHFSMSKSVIYGTDEDIFGLELYLAFLRLTQADESLIKTYEEKKNAIVGM